MFLAFSQPPGLGTFPLEQAAAFLAQYVDSIRIRWSNSSPTETLGNCFA